MNNRFLSLTDSHIEDEKFTELIDKANAFILNMNHVIEIIKYTKNTDHVYLNKFKLITDINTLYDDPHIVNILKNIKTEQYNNVFNRNIDDIIADMTISSTTSDNNSVNCSDNEQGSGCENDQESGCENDQESGCDEEPDDGLQNIYLKMINTEYDNIQKSSVLKQYVDIIRDDNVSFKDSE